MEEFNVEEGLNPALPSLMVGPAPRASAKRGADKRLLSDELDLSL
jgi:hypothetical protein